MIITPANLEAFFLNLRTGWNAAYQATTPWSQQIATTVPSTTSENRYGWMGQLPRMREWIGERNLKNLMSHSYTLQNKTWENSFKVRREELEDDQYGLYSSAAADLASQAAKLPDQLVATVLKAGTTTTCFDGQAFFSTSHPTNPGGIGGTTYSNYSSSGKALTADNLASVIAAMGSYVGEDGYPLSITPNLLIVPPALDYTARQIVNAALIPNTAGTATASNVLQGVVSILKVPELAGADTTWYVADTTKIVKPFVYQLRRSPTFTALTDPSSEGVFYRNEYAYGCDARANAGVSLPFLMYKAVA